MKLTKKAFAASAACLGVAALLSSGVASADPSGAPTYRQLAGTGSDTTEEIMQAMSDAVTISGTKVIGSYNATGSATIQTKDDPACIMNRPNGSGNGRTALVNSLNAGDGCLQFARSSSPKGTTSTTPDLTWIPFATENLTFAVVGSGSVPKNLTLAQLQAIYTCTVPSIVPTLPQSGSGTRSFWLQTIFGSSSPDLTPYPCISGANEDIWQEHDGRGLPNNAIMPYSVAQWIAQATGTIADKRGNTTLGKIGGVIPVAGYENFGVKRDLFNLIPTAQEGTAPYSTVFVGPSSLICTNVDVLAAYGLVPAANCGDTSEVS